MVLHSIIALSSKLEGVVYGLLSEAVRQKLLGWLFLWPLHLPLVALSGKSRNILLARLKKK